MPSLSNNRLNIEEVSDQSDLLDIQTQPAQTPCNPHPRLPSWEQKLPKQLTIAAIPLAHSLDLHVEILPTSGTEEARPVTALLDCGATGLFMDTDYVKQQKLTTCRLSHPIPMNNVDGTPNEAGPIEEIVGVILRYHNHSQLVQFAVT
ncbi:hypothetical protein L208DRAFT_1343554, partial [Tricholoma matsutake]